MSEVAFDDVGIPKPPLDPTTHYHRHMLSQKVRLTFCVPNIVTASRGTAVNVSFKVFLNQAYTYMLLGPCMAKELVDLT